MHVQGLIQQLMDSLLRSRQYDSAMQFAAPLLATDASYQEAIGPRISREANRLLNEPDEKHWQDVVDLVAQAQKMDPPLDARYVGPLQDTAKRALSKLQERQRSPASAGPSSGGRLPGVVDWVGPRIGS
jgi:hypothetical protein